MKGFFEELFFLVSKNTEKSFFSFELGMSLEPCYELHNFIQLKISSFCKVVPNTEKTHLINAD